MQKVWILFVMLLVPFFAFASVEFYSLLPNPLGDDTLGEYIEIRNTGCQTVDLGGYQLYDATKKPYIIPAQTLVASHANIQFVYATTKIALNNSGLESITLADPLGVIIDSESYSGTQKDNIVIHISTVDEDCTLIPPVENNTGTIDDSTGSGNDSSSGAIESPIIDTNTGAIQNGSGSSSEPESQGAGTGATDTTSSGSDTSNSGVVSPPIEIIPTGSGGSESSGVVMPAQDSSGQIDEPKKDEYVADIGATNTGMIVSNTGSVQVFPEILHTRQEPTNAIFTGGVWDCGTYDPCRINVTFDPIFTGGLLSKNYICEVITSTGTLTTCNPNTLYFSTGSSFTFRLTSKTDVSQSRSVNWSIVFAKLNPTENTITLATSTGAENSPLQNSSTGSIGSTDTGSTNSGATSSGVTFPEIIPTFQNYTNTYNSGDILSCMMSPCRVNFTLEPIFTGSYIAKDYTCEITYGTGVYSSCNPPQLYPIGTGSIDIVLTHKSSGQKNTKTIQIAQGITTATVTTEAASVSPPLALDTNPPIAVLEYDGKLKSYHEQVSDYEMNYYTLTCAINLTAEKSYDPEGGSLKYIWYYGGNDLKTSKDPGERKYGLGDHQIWLRVIDTAGNVASIRYYIHVLGPKEKEEIVKTEKKTKAKKVSNSGSGDSAEGEKKKKKPAKITFFDPPNIVLQNSKFVETEDGYLCHTTTKSCSLNLTLTGTLKGLLYTWEYDDGEILVSKNPKSRPLAPGLHMIRVTAGYASGSIIWTRDISAQVVKIQKAKKPKVVKPPKSAPKKDTIVTPTTPPEVEIPEEEELPYTTVALISGIMPLALLRRLIIGMV